MCDHDGPGWEDIALAGALAEEINYFLNCVINQTPPTVITPEESMAAVVACLAAEKSATTGEVIKVAEMI